MGAPKAADPEWGNSGAAYVVYGREPGAVTNVRLSDLGPDGFRIVGQFRDDLAGISVAGAGDVNGDGLADVILGAPSAATTGRGAAYVVYGQNQADPADLDLDALAGRGFVITGADVDSAGVSVAAAGDVNNDNLADVVVGAHLASHNYRNSSGSAYVVYGRAGADPEDIYLGYLGNLGFRVDGATSGDQVGFSVAGVGDVNNDGIADVVLGAPTAGFNGRSNSGSAYVVYGQAVADPADIDLTTLGARGLRIDGAAANDQLGVAVAGAGDVNGDDRADVILGAFGADPNGGFATGAAYVLYGQAMADPGDVDLFTLGRRGFGIDGIDDRGQLGGSVAGVGDVNGDGLADVAMGARGSAIGGHAASGAVYGVYGERADDVPDVNLGALGHRGFRIDGSADGDGAGSSIAGVGDLDADGHDDLMIGATGADSYNHLDAGAAFVVSGASTSPGVPQVTLDATSLSFGDQMTDTASGTQTVTVTNSGTTPLALSRIELTGADASQFDRSTGTGGGTCSTVDPVAAGASCTVTLGFHPTSAGDKAATLSLGDNASNAPHTVSLSGTGVGVAAIAVDPGSLDFGGLPVGTTSEVKTVTVSNNGDAPLTLGTIAVTGYDKDYFQRPADAAGGTCTSAERLMPGARCTVAVTFTATRRGSLSAALSISSNVAGSPTAVPLAGAGLAADMSLGTTALAFGDQVVGTSGTQTVVVTSTGEEPLNIGELVWFGDDASAFDRPAGTAGGTCSASEPLVKGDSCTLVVRFTPTSVGDKTALLAVHFTAPASLNYLQLRGTGTTAPIAPAVDLDAESLAFGDQVVGSTSATKVLTVTNSGTAPLALSDIGFVGEDAGQFVRPAGVEGGTCSVADPVTVGGSCTIAVRFVPTSAGVKSAAVEITDDAADSPHTVALSGNGVAVTPIKVADLRVTASCRPEMVVPGQQVRCDMRASNEGPDAAERVTITSTLSGGLVWKSRATGPGVSCTAPSTGAPLTCLISNPLPPGRSISLTSALTVPRDAGPGRTYGFTSVISSSTADPEPGNNMGNDTFVTRSCTIDGRHAHRKQVIRGTRGDDVICGSSRRDVIFGRGGNDVIYGMNGSDVLKGGSGRDYLYGAQRRDILMGGSGIDQLYGGAGGDLLIGGRGEDQLYGGPGHDRTHG